ncbi:MAG: hypothetical protein QME63_02085 [Actinomycetota bacterium]|nr:hypothetical protein [Actinomycetota bacterium]
MRKVTIMSLFLTFLLVAGLFFAYTYFFSDNAKDSCIWQRVVENKLVKKDVQRIEVKSYSKTLKVPPSKYEFVISELKQARFYKSNSEKFGPTPETSIFIYYRNNSYTWFNYWGGNGIFEHSEDINGEHRQWLQ